MKAFEIYDHIMQMAKETDPPVNIEQTCDRIVCGDPEKEVHRLLVTWMSTTKAVQWAATRGYDMLITHEATLWGPEIDILSQPVATVSEVRRPGETRIDTVIRWEPGTYKWEKALEKKKRMEESGIVILRVHDTWDLYPEIGIPYAWARYLGFQGNPTARGGPFKEQHRYDIEPIRLDDLAAAIAQRTAFLGEPAVQVFGNGDKRVSRVGFGTGCGTNIYTYIMMGCDVSIVCDDNWEARSFLDIAFARDHDHAIIRVNHAVSEEPGMVTLAEHLQKRLPEIRVDHLPQEVCFRLIGSRKEDAE